MCGGMGSSKLPKLEPRRPQGTAARPPAAVVGMQLALNALISVIFVGFDLIDRIVDSAARGWKLFVYLSFYPSMYPPEPICLSIHLSDQLHLSIRVSMHLCTFLSIFFDLSVHLSNHVYLSICPSIQLSIRCPPMLGAQRTYRT